MNMRWIDFLVLVFQELGGESQYQGSPGIYSKVEELSRQYNRPLSREWQATVRRVIETYSSDSDNFNGIDVFQHVDKGRWRLRSTFTVAR